MSVRPTGGNSPSIQRPSVPLSPALSPSTGAPASGPAQGSVGTAQDTFARTGGSGDRDLPDPAVLSKDLQSLSYRRVENGSLYVDGISHDDVIQGSIANCYMMSAFSALAYTHPDAIEDAIKDNGDGTYTVTLYSDRPDGTMGPTPVTVDDQVAMSSWGSTSNYGKARDGKELWVSILEKAYAQLRGGYDAVGNGGHPGHVFSTVLGLRHTWYNTGDQNPDALFNTLAQATANKRPMAAETHAANSGVNYSGTGLHAWHSYSVLGTVEEQGQKFVMMRNPWGHTEPGNDGKNDGTFKLPFADFMKLFTKVTVG